MVRSLRGRLSYEVSSQLIHISLQWALLLCEKFAQPKQKVFLWVLPLARRGAGLAPRSPLRSDSHTYRCVRRRLSPEVGSTLQRSA